MIRKIIFVIGLGTSVLVYAHFRTLDGMTGLIFGTLLPEDTVYASGYSDSGFRRIRVGMSRAEVESLVGAPQKEWPVEQVANGPDVGARWSYSPADTNFRCRVVLFRKGAVVAKHTEFYLD
jgi:hypothetical protein